MRRRPRIALRCITLLTNQFDLQASQIAQLYKSRWQVELFFNLFSEISGQ